MTKPTGVREIIEGIELREVTIHHRGVNWPTSKAVDKSAFDKVVAIALELEKQRNEKILGVERWPTTDAIADHYNAKLLKIAKGEA